LLFKHLSGDVGIEDATFPKTFVFCRTPMLRYEFCTSLTRSNGQFFPKYFVLECIWVNEQSLTPNRTQYKSFWRRKQILCKLYLLPFGNL